MKKLLTIFLSLLALTAFGQTHGSHHIGTPLAPSQGITIDPQGNLKSDSSRMPLNISIAALRASTTLQTARAYHITDAGRQGDFLYSAASHADDGGLYLVDGSGNTWARSYTGDVHDSWFGVLHDGTTNNTVTVQKFLNAISGKNAMIDAGVALVDSVSIPTWVGTNLHGVGGDTSEYRGVNGVQMFYVVGDQTGVTMHDMKLNCTTVTTTAQNFGNALYYSIGVHTKNCEWYNINWTAPNANIDGLAILVQVSGAGGSFDGVKIHNCKFVNIGAAITLLNRDTTGTVGLVASVASGTVSTVIRNTGLDSGKNFSIDHNEIGNLALASGALFGFAVTLDGCGYNGVFSYNHVFNCLNIALENTGFWYMDWGFNNFDKAISGRTWEAWSFGNVPLRPIYFNTIHDNKEAEFMPTTDAFYGVNYSKFDHNTWRSAGGIKFANSNYNTIDHDYIFGSTFNSLVLTPRFNNNVNYGTCVGNTWSWCTFDQSTSALNVYALLLDGIGTQNNTFDHCEFKRTPTGNFYAFNQDTCGNLNYITNPIVNGSAVANAYRLITVPSGTRDTLRHEDDLFDWKFFKFASNTSPGSVWLQSNVHRDFTVWNASAFVDTLWNTATSTNTLVPPGSIVHYSGDSSNFNPTTGGTGIFPGALKNTGPDSVIGNFYASGTAQIVGDLTTASIIGDSVMFANASIAPQGFATIFYKQTVTGSANTPVGLFVRVDNAAHNSASPTGIITYLNAASGDSLTNAIGVQAQINPFTGYINNAVGFQTLNSSTSNNITTFTGFWAGHLNVGTNTYVGFYNDQNKGANQYALRDIGTAVNYLRGATFIGGATPDSVYQLHVSGGMTQQDSAFEEASAQVGQGNTNPDTVTRGICAIYEDPVSTLASKTIVLPAASLIGQGHRIRIFFGGALTTGVVITSLTVSAQSGQSIIQNATPTTANAGDYLEYEYRFTSSSAGKYYRIH